MNHIFVWTFDGVMEALFLGICLLLVLIFAVAVVVERVKLWWRK